MTAVRVLVFLLTTLVVALSCFVAAGLLFALVERVLGLRR